MFSQRSVRYNSIFDGYNIPVETFIRCCDQARTLVHPRTLVNLEVMIGNKIQGHAIICLNQYDTNLNILLKSIKQKFAPEKILLK